MGRLTRYVLRQIVMAMLFVTAALSIAVWLLQSLRLVDLIVNRGLSVGLFLYLAILILPRFVEVVLPVAAFVAVLFIYTKLGNESELVVMRAAGVSQGALARPAILAGLLATLVLYSLSLWLVPNANRDFRNLEFQIRNRFATVLIQDGVFNSISDRLMVYDTGRNAAGDLLGIVIYDMREPQKPVTIFAARGAFVDSDAGPRLFMVNGTRQQRDNTTGRLSVLTFKKYTFDIAALDDGAGGRSRDPDELSTRALLFPPHPPASAAAARALFLEANMRLAAPLAGMALAMLPILCLLPGEFNRRGQSTRALTATALAVLIEFVDLGLRDLSARLDAALPLLYLNMLLPILATAWFVWRDWRSAPARLAARPT